MKTRLSPEDFYNSLPKKRLGSIVLFFNAEGKILILKPNYKEGWVIPGGTVEANESPRAAAFREVKEEIGLEVSNIDLVCVSYRATKGAHKESLLFIYHGGTLSEEQIAAMRLADDEVDAYQFASVEEVDALSAPGIKERMPMYMEALKKGTVLYLEV